MIGVVLFLDELLAYFVLVCVKGRMVVIVYPSVGVSPRTLKGSGRGNTFSANSMTQVNVDGRVAFRCGNITQVFQDGKGRVPIAVGCGVLTAKPSDEVTVIEIEGNQG